MNVSRTQLGVLMALLLTVSAAGQFNDDMQKLVQATHAFYGPSDLLNAGEIYRPENRQAKGDPYFLTASYTPVTLSIKGNVFANVKAKYNIVTDQLILVVSSDSIGFAEITARKNWIDSFRLDKHHFVNLAAFDTVRNLTGYFELVYKGKNSAFIKYTKEFINTHDQYQPQGYFAETKSAFYVFEGPNLVRIRNKKNFLNLYDDHKKELRKYINKNKIRFSKPSATELHELMKFCDALFKTS